MKKLILVIILIIIGVISAIGASFYWKNLRGIGPSLEAPPQDINEVINATGMPLKLPAGFSIEIFAKNLPGARVMVFDDFGNMWISRTSKGIVSQLEIDRETGKVKRQGDVFRDLDNPHGLAFDPEFRFALYIAEEHQLRRIGTYSDDPGQIVLENLPSGGGHSTRTLGFGPDKKLYISVGSSCNVCRESNEQRATILQFDPQTKKAEIFAKGLRNSVFFTWHPETRKLWATEMGRDLLGDNVPPDEINIVEQGKNYGWPICYGKNIHDSSFDKNTYIRNPCMEPFETGSYLDIPAHSAPLGLAFFPKEGWQKEFDGDLLVAYHGSWNRSEPTGYKIVRIKLDKQGKIEGVEDFITGWLTPDGALGRPVDIIFHNENIFISDDKAGVIYRVYRK